MTWRWQGDTITRVRPAVTQDSHGDEQYDWSDPDELVLDRVMFAPGEDGERAGGTVYATRTLDIATTDHVLWRELRFEVVGVPQQWGPGTVVVLEGVDTPGQ